ncbi:MAG: ATP synthase F1 subunit gamma [Desulfosalsimonadaceae bacterium]
MASLKEIKSKISGVKKTKQITRAMNMVAASKLRGAQGAMDAFRPYAEKFAEVLGNIADKTTDETSPLLIPKDEVNNVHVVMLTSDRGLCGGFNSNLMDKTEEIVEDFQRRGVNVSLTAFGKKGRDWARKEKLTIADQYLDVVGGKFGFNVASSFGQKAIEGFLFGDYDEVHIVYSEFRSMANQIPVVKQLLPIVAIEKPEETETAAEDSRYLPEHICEPSADALLNTMLPKSIYIQIYHALLETSTSEHAARMRAMDNATKACDDMIESLTLTYNKARQQSITMELMDIVGGAEALRG